LNYISPVKVFLSCGPGERGLKALYPALIRIRDTCLIFVLGHLFVLSILFPYVKVIGVVYSHELSGRKGAKFGRTVVLPPLVFGSSPQKALRKVR